VEYVHYFISIANENAHQQSSGQTELKFEKCVIGRQVELLKEISQMIGESERAGKWKGEVR
jgi:hypothetical protein